MYYEATRLKSALADPANSILRDCTIAKAGVAARGHYVDLDSSGRVTRDPSQAVKRAPMVTDAKTLSTLVASATAAGGRFKVRSDHDDAISARAGFADNVRSLGDRVVCDIHLNDSYRDREIVMEVAKDTPELIGLSIDFVPSFEVVNGQAFMRVDALNAIDIVDTGAITHQGLYLRQGPGKPATPSVSGTEKIETFAALAERLLSSKSGAQNAVAHGKLRSLGDGVGCQTYRTADLDALREKNVARLSAEPSKMSRVDRDSLQRELVRLKAERPNGFSDFRFNAAFAAATLRLGVK